MEGHASRSKASTTRVRDRLVAGRVIRPAEPTGRNAGVPTNELATDIASAGGAE